MEATAQLPRDWPCATRSAQRVGFVSLGGLEDNKIFWWLAEAERQAEAAPLLLWLGADCSAMTALLTENGPCIASTNSDPKPNRFSWAQFANVLWVDPIAGAGFSYSGAGLSRDQWSAATVTDYVVGFLRSWLTDNPSYR